MKQLLPNPPELSEKEQQIAQYISLGIIIIATIILTYLRIKGVIPGTDAVIEWLEGWYAKYGYTVVFISALLEGLFLANLYIPGSTAIVLGVVFAQRSGLSAPLMVALAILGFMISYTVNYFVGYYGLHRVIAKSGYVKELTETSERMSKSGPLIIFTSFFHPNLAALMSVGAGIIQMPFLKFFSMTTVALIFWDSVWGLLAFYLGEQVLKVIENPWAAPLIMLWVLVALYLPTRIFGRKKVDKTA